jgi:hypothetical protein
MAPGFYFTIWGRNMMRFGLAAFTFIVLLATALVGQSNPAPFVNQPLVPSAVAPGSLGFTLTVNGTGFVSCSVVRWNGSPRTTTFVTASQLTASIGATDVAVAGTATITVTSPAPEEYQILGQGFTGTTSVTNGVAATKFSVVSDTYMTAVVPAGATTGAVVVATPAGNLTSNVSFRISK